MERVTYNEASTSPPPPKSSRSTTFSANASMSGGSATTPDLDDVTSASLPPSTKVADKGVPAILGATTSIEDPATSQATGARPKLTLKLGNKRAADEDSGRDAREPPAKKAKAKTTEKATSSTKRTGKASTPTVASTPTRDSAEDTPLNTAAKPKPVKKPRKPSVRNPRSRAITAAVKAVQDEQRAKNASSSPGEERTPTPPPASASPPPPSQITKAVAAKVQQICDFVQTNHSTSNSQLSRDVLNPNLVSIAASSITSALTLMRIHFELFSENEDQPSVADVEEAIVERYMKAFTEADVEYVTLDISRPGRIETQIKDKIAGHGLERVNLLEVELEMFVRNQMRTFCSGDVCSRLENMQEHESDAIRRQRFFQQVWERIHAPPAFVAPEALQADCDVLDSKPVEMDGNASREIGRRGVCVAPMQAV